MRRLFKEKSESQPWHMLATSGHGCNQQLSLPCSALLWETALILDLRTEATDRFMWVQEGRLRSVIRAVKSPAGLHRPAGGTGCVRRFFEHPGGLTTRALRETEKFWPQESWCTLSGKITSMGTTTISRQEAEWKQTER